MSICSAHREWTPHCEACAVTTEEISPGRIRFVPAPFPEDRCGRCLEKKGDTTEPYCAECLELVTGERALAAGAGD